MCAGGAETRPAQPEPSPGLTPYSGFSRPIRRDSFPGAQPHGDFLQGTHLSPARSAYNPEGHWPGLWHKLSHPFSVWSQPRAASSFPSLGPEKHSVPEFLPGMFAWDSRDQCAGYWHRLRYVLTFRPLPALLPSTKHG